MTTPAPDTHELCITSVVHVARHPNPNVSPFYVGPMNKVCPYCGALRFVNELLNCCHNGKVKLPELYYPDELKEVLTGNSIQ